MYDSMCSMNISFCFFKQKTAYEMRISDWSSDVCSSDLTRVLVNVLPLTPDTESILNRENLQQLQVGGYVINVARGQHVVDEDLLALIDEGHLQGALLDVFRVEPLPAGHPYWTHPKVRVTPQDRNRTRLNSSH